MIARIRPARLRGEVKAVTSKSCAHRALICAALSDRPTDVMIDAANDDIFATARCLEAMGARIEISGARWRVSPCDEARIGPDPVLDCGESGSTLRFLLPVAGLLRAKTRFVGHGRLPERPHTDLIAAMRANGASVSSDTLPLTVRGPLRPGAYALPGHISSQYFSGLLFALPRLGGTSAIRFTTPPSSVGYLRLTLNALRQFGVSVAETGEGYDIPGGQVYRSPGQLTVEGDWSAAAFWYECNALGGGVTIRGLDEHSAQGDGALCGLLERMRLTPPGGVCEIDADPVPDLVPALAAAATGMRGETRFVNAARLRLKECDRLSAMAEGLGAMGADVTEEKDALTVRPSRLHGARVRGWGDHRIVMALAVAAASAAGESEITDAEAVSKSYPGFWRDYQALGGDAHVEQAGS